MTVTVVGIGGSFRGPTRSPSGRCSGAVGRGRGGREDDRAHRHRSCAAVLRPGRARAAAESAHRLIELLREADGVVLVSPGYHGSLSGLVKNALDYVQDLSGDQPPFLDGRAVGCVGRAMAGRRR